jgi:uncharacterized repeat protein (TIGR01451 family)
VTLEKFNSTQSPVVYDVTVSTLDSTVLVTDLGVSITGNQSSLNVGETVKLTIIARNEGPNPANVKVNYKIPLGLKLLSYNGAGTYDSSTGIWSVGILPAGGNVTLELTLQANNAGAIVNTAIVYSDLSDLNPLNNQAGFNLVTNALDLDDIPGGELNGLLYTFPPDIKPPNPPTPPDTPLLPPIPPTPGPTPPDNPPIPPNPNPPAEPQKPSTQLGRDIAGVRQAVSSGNTEENVPEWTGDPGPEFTQEEYEGWVKTMLKLSVEVIAFGIIEFTPSGGSASGEYLQGIKNAFLNNFRTLNTITKYFGNNRYIGQISEAFKDARKVINNPTVEKIVNAWDKFLNKWNFNYGMEVFKRGLYKLFPGQESKIDALLLCYSSYQFITDPLGTLNAIADIITSILLEGKLPDRESFEKVFIFDPAQDK